MRQQVFFPGWFRPSSADPTLVTVRARTLGRVSARRWLAEHAGRLAIRSVLVAALLLVVAVGGLAVLRTLHDGKVYPGVYVAGESLAGLDGGEARAALAAKAEAVEGSRVAFTHEGQAWTASVGELGVKADPEAAFTAAYGIGREPRAAQRLGTTAGLIREDRRIPLGLSLDRKVLDRWFDRIDRELRRSPREATLAVDGTSVSVIPEVDGTIVDREAAAAALVAALRDLRPLSAPLPTLTEPARVRVGDLDEARATLSQALSQSVQVVFGDAYWTLSPADLGRFVEPRIDREKQGAVAFSLAMDEDALAAWLNEKLASDINRDPLDAEVGWNGEGLVSTVESVDGARLQPGPLAESVSESFFGGHDAVPAAVTVTKPTVDSANLGKLGIITLLGTGTSNYSGSDAGRATNVEVGAALMNGTLVPPGGEFSFNGAVGVINDANGFVEAQVIDGERIGKDIGGGICQVSTTVFRAAYLAGLQMGDWFPHRYQIPFYEYDGWPPGLDASILQPTEDPATWGDFTFINPSRGWMLVESWSTGANVIVNIYGPDLGYTVETDGPFYGERRQVKPDMEIVDEELEPGTIKKTESPLEGLQVSHVRRVLDRDGGLLRQGSFDTTYESRGNVWVVSPDQKGKSDADPDRPLPKPQAPPPDEGAMEDAAAGEAMVDGVSVTEEPAPVDAVGDEVTSEASVAEEPVYEEAAPMGGTSVEDPSTADGA